MRPDFAGRLRAVSGAQLAAAIAVALGTLVLAAVVLKREDVRLAGTNSVRPDQIVQLLRPGERVCQTDVLIPAGTAGVRVAVGTRGQQAPPLTVTVRNSGQQVRLGTVSGYAGDARPIARFPTITETSAGNQLCLRVKDTPLTLVGQPDPAADGASSLRFGDRELPADLSLQFVRDGKESLLQLVPTVFHRASLFRPGWVGSWTYYVLAALAVLLVLAAVTALFAPAGGSPTITGIALVGTLAFLNAGIWSLVTPVFQAPDEAGHYAYVQSLVERGESPSRSLTGGEGSYTKGLALAVDYTAVGVVQNVDARPPWTGREEREWAQQEDALGSSATSGGGGYTTAAGYTPFYYWMEALPYKAGGGGDNVLSSLWLMRLLSALMVAGAAAFAFLFAREVAPSIPWLPMVAGLAVAFQPMLAFIGGALNNDNLLFLFSGAQLYLLARALRRGLDASTAVAIGAVLGLGAAVKPTMLALVPLSAAVVGWCLYKSANPRPVLFRFAGLATAALALTIAARYIVFPHDEAIADSFDADAQSRPFALADFLSYLWQWYLPPLPFMNDRFHEAIPAYDIFFKGAWASFGHVDTQFEWWVYTLLALATAVGLGMIAVTLFKRRAELPALAPRILLAIVAVASFALLVNVRSYLAYIQSDAPFAQGRYLLPAIAVFGVAVGTAALAFGRRSGLAAGTAFVFLIGVLNLFSLGLVLSRFYT